MQAYVYVDGFNLYYRALKGTALKWVNLSQLATRLLDPADTVAKVRYFTARVSARSGDPDAPRRQQIFFNALKTVPNLDFHYGRFLPKKKMRPLVSTGKFVQVHDTEEKGSDVNLATHLLNDGWHKRYDVALDVRCGLFSRLATVRLDLGRTASSHVWETAALLRRGLPTWVRLEVDGHVDGLQAAPRPVRITVESQLDTLRTAA